MAQYRATSKPDQPPWQPGFLTPSDCFPRFTTSCSRAPLLGWLGGSQALQRETLSFSKNPRICAVIQRFDAGWGVAWAWGLTWITRPANQYQSSPFNAVESPSLGRQVSWAALLFSWLHISYKRMRRPEWFTGVPNHFFSHRMRGYVRLW